jgi:hypothetical protein
MHDARATANTKANTSKLQVTDSNFVTVGVGAGVGAKC